MHLAKCSHCDLVSSACALRIAGLLECLGAELCSMPLAHATIGFQLRAVEAETRRE